MELVKTIQELSDLCGVSGDEDAVRDYIAAKLTCLCEFHTDPLGNLLAFKKGQTAPKNKLLLSVHMDEVGFIITHIEDSGLLRFAAVGGIDSRVVIGRPVELGKDRIYGVIGAKATHHLEEKEKEEPAKLEQLLIDIGAKDREDAEKLVQPGDRAVFYSQFQRLGTDKIMGRALDDRAGCALLLHLLEGELAYDCHFAFTVQEESGCVGGITAGYTVNPDISIVVETTTASDIAGITPDKVVCKLGGGPVISFMDRGTIYDRDLYRLGMDTAKAYNIPVQAKEGIFGGNEARSIQTARGGARMMAVSLPCRYLHSPSNVLCESDIHHTAALLERIIEAAGNL